MLSWFTHITRPHLHILKSKQVTKNYQTKTTNKLENLKLKTNILTSNRL